MFYLLSADMIIYCRSLLVKELLRCNAFVIKSADSVAIAYLNTIFDQQKQWIMPHDSLCFVNHVRIDLNDWLLKTFINLISQIIATHNDVRSFNSSNSVMVWKGGLKDKK